MGWKIRCHNGKEFLLQRTGFSSQHMWSLTTVGHSSSRDLAPSSVLHGLLRAQDAQKLTQALTHTQFFFKDAQH